MVVTGITTDHALHRDLPLHLLHQGQDQTTLQQQDQTTQDHNLVVVVEDLEVVVTVQVADMVAVEDHQEDKSAEKFGNLKKILYLCNRNKIV